MGEYALNQVGEHSVDEVVEQIIATDNDIVFLLEGGTVDSLEGSVQGDAWDEPSICAIGNVVYGRNDETRICAITGEDYFWEKKFIATSTEFLVTDGSRIYVQRGNNHLYVLSQELDNVQHLHLKGEFIQDCISDNGYVHLQVTDGKGEFIDSYRDGERVLRRKLPIEEQNMLTGLVTAGGLMAGGKSPLVVDVNSGIWRGNDSGFDEVGQVPFLATGSYLEQAQHLGAESVLTVSPSEELYSAAIPQGTIFAGSSGVYLVGSTIQCLDNKDLEITAMASKGNKLYMANAAEIGIYEIEKISERPN